MIGTVRDCKRLLEDLKRLPVLDDLLCKPILKGDGDDDNIGSVLSPHNEDLIDPVKLRKKGRSSLLLLRDSVLRAASATSPNETVTGTEDRPPRSHSG